MSSRDYLKHTLSNSSRATNPGDEYWDSVNNKLYKNVLINGNTTTKLELLTSRSTVVASGTTTVATVNNRVAIYADGTSITIDLSITDIASQINTQAIGTLTINAPINATPTDGAKLVVRIRSTNVQTFSWNAIFVSSTDLILPTVTSGANKTDYIGFIYNSGVSKWQILAKNFGF